MTKISVELIDHHTDELLEKVTFTGNFEGKTILDALGDEGVELASGCLAGSCGVCRVNIISGINNVQNANIVEQDTIESIDPLDKTLRMACCAEVKGELTLRAKKSLYAKE